MGHSIHGGGGYLGCSGVGYGGGEVSRVTLTGGGDYSAGWDVSYWNAFLLLLCVDQVSGKVDNGSRQLGVQLGVPEKR